MPKNILLCKPRIIRMPWAFVLFKYFHKQPSTCALVVEEFVFDHSSRVLIVVDMMPFFVCLELDWLYHFG